MTRRTDCGPADHKFQKFDDTWIFCEKCGSKVDIAAHACKGVCVHWTYPAIWPTYPTWRPNTWPTWTVLPSSGDTVTYPDGSSVTYTVYNGTTTSSSGLLPE